MMKTVRLVEPGRPLEHQAVPVPEIGPRDVLVRVKAAGICHSDAHYRAGTSRVGPLPLTLGHEVAGEPIEEARLQAIPWARFSLRGQQEVEAGGSGRRRAIPPLQSLVEAELTSEPESEEPEREQAV